jgi:hypothetical protein
VVSVVQCWPSEDLTCGGHRRGQRYPTELTEVAWTIWAPLMAVAKAGGQPRTTDMRAVVHAILYSLRTGLPMAHASHRFSALADRLPCFPALAPGRRLGADA